MVMFHSYVTVYQRVTYITQYNWKCMNMPFMSANQACCLRGTPPFGQTSSAEALRWTPKQGSSPEITGSLPLQIMASKSSKNLGKMENTMTPWDIRFEHMDHMAVFDHIYRKIYIYICTIYTWYNIIRDLLKLLIRFPSFSGTFSAQGCQAVYHVHGQGTYQATRIGREGIKRIGCFLLGMGGTWGFFGANNGEIFNMLAKKQWNVQQILWNLRGSWDLSGFECDRTWFKPIHQQILNIGMGE